MGKKFNRSFKTAVDDMLSTFVQECRIVFHDSGVLIIFLVAGILYPPLYNIIYRNEAVVDMPIAAIDDSHTTESRRYLQKLDATDKVSIDYICMNLGEAQKLLGQRKIHGIVYIPADYANRLASNQQATISVYDDMSSFLYYKNMTMATNFVMLDEMKKIEIDRYNAMGVEGEQAQQLVSALDYEDAMLYNPGNGFSSFFLPAVLILIIQQTMFFGIAMVGGTQREQNRNMALIPERLRGRGISRIVFGKSLAYFLIYSILTAYVVGLIPLLFNMPHIGNIWHLLVFMLPFVTACIFFSLMLSVMIRNRESGLVLFLFFTLILLFLSGFSWPQSNIPAFWKYFSYLFPSTFGIQGYIKINSAGANLGGVTHEFIILCIQTVVYFALTSIVMIGECKLKTKREQKNVCEQ